MKRNRTVQVYRYRCCHCRRTSRFYPAGVNRADQAERLRRYAAILWVLGLSLRSVKLALSAFNLPLSHLKQTVPPEWLWVLDEIKQLLTELPLEGSRRLFDLWKLVPEKRSGQSGERSPLEQLCHLLIRMRNPLGQLPGV